VSGFAVIRLHEIPTRDGWIPIRDHFGIGSFGVNAWLADEAGNVISEHTETWSGHEELYVVVEGHATFTIDGEEIDAPAGTLVFVGDPEVRRGAVEKEAGTTVLTVGGPPGQAFEITPMEDAWEENQEAMKLYRDERYGEAAEVARKALESRPESARLYYNLACFESKAGADVATVAEHLARAIELYPRFAGFAREDADFEPVLNDPAFQRALGGTD
jgi:AraC-like protein